MTAVSAFAGLDGLKADCAVLVAVFLLSVVPQSSAQTDSGVVRLPAVEITGAGANAAAGRPAAVQTIPFARLHLLPALQLSDALRHLSGTVIKDYGGIGGMKTVSARGLGTQHTGVAYDGILLSDCQTGQIDLGKIFPDHIRSVGMTVGPVDPIFVPARFFSNGSLLSVETQPSAAAGPLSLRAGLTAGSFGLFSPSVFAAHRVDGKKRPGHSWAWNIASYCLRSDGDYPYVLRNGDSVSHLHRQNSDAAVFSAECNGSLQLGNRRRLTVKGYCYDSEKGLPKATVFDNLSSAERLWNRNAFGQWQYRSFISRKWAFMTSGKLNYDYTRYLNPEYLNAGGRLENEYRQYEGYLSNVVGYRPFGGDTTGHRPDAGLALSQDIVYNLLKANSLEGSRPSRWTTYTNLAAYFKTPRVKVSGSLLLTTADNSARDGAAGSDFVNMSPAVGAVVSLGRAFEVKAFYKNVFRMPTFNDLYYRDIGNVGLRPEKARQFNVGLGYFPHFTSAKTDLSLQANGYFNIVKDKIVAFPNRNIFIWSMLNYGKVHIAGAEAVFAAECRLPKTCAIHVYGNFTCQHAVDRTDPAGKTYNHQIPYTPKFSGSAGIDVKTPWADISYYVFWCGKRYALRQNIPANEIAPYADQSLVLGHDFHFGKCRFGLKFELLNLADARYEIVKNYPIQGRSFRVKAVFGY